MLIKPDIEEEAKILQKQLDDIDEIELCVDEIQSKLTTYKEQSTMKYFIYALLGIWGMSIVLIITLLPFMIFIKWFFN